ncbi:hypothetical protein M406DRAFT_244789 [Cryphonectria parasitica EP155]|uniref:Uncharacterized protein n=1 Tax=Cryphonectria parasitica (strain ATCC 38755 / EP155) TaxID=660469 RepID=A0A9P4YBW5_CRYP1|nr:uncharacterized protein M406DRAFT_244789 [Cryphonectria parasitica EP155]KAF3770647.1 hypothetical protein M406DRAFT_244789 [Cryphonectria parasitica EP155]
MQTFQLSFPLPRSLDTRIYIHLTVQAKSIMLFLTTASADEMSSPPTMGSFVYSLPDKFNPSQPLSTPLFSVESSLEFTSRLARLLAKRAQLPVYVGSSVSLAGAGLGGTVEEEMEAFKTVVEVVTEKLQTSQGITNGVSGISISDS